MFKSHEKFHSANGKRLILVADDELINREILGMVLQNDYQVIFARDGQEALALIEENREILSLVLMDLKMPVMGGLDVLRCMKEKPELARIPVIVLTSDQDAEIESLSLGAIDFIPKPYPQAGVMLARILRTIELSEDRQIINSTERDPLTGLYNREYFYRYAEQFDQHHRELEMDAIVLDINHFHMINERFGTSYGDRVLRGIGERIREMVADTGGIVCRREADTFMIYCPHGTSWKDLLERASTGITENDLVNNRVRLRMGVYEKADKSMDIERRFDRAKMAADTVRNSFTKTIGIYDNALHEKELYSERLIEEFYTAIREKQFQVFYQPKFDVRPEIPVLASAEALVRWFHPELGMISPGVFIPLFEENGLIQTLDHYVWRAAAEQIRGWKEKFDFTVPVSVNVSRIDMYDPRLVDDLQEILADNGLTPDELLLEITESAYTQDSVQIIETVNRMRDLGFRIEMDDFGTGYSSLNMISTLPIDALKLDMQFIRNAFKEGGDTRMLEIIIDIADYLSVPVIAEGVETEDQLTALRDMGCDLVQGYYFSRPVPAEEYERFVIERKELSERGDQEVISPETRKRPAGRPDPGQEDPALGGIVTALSRDYETIYYIDTQTSHYVEFGSEGKLEDLQIERSGADFFKDMKKCVRKTVLKEDQDRVLLSLQKDVLMKQLRSQQIFSLTYRLLIEGRSRYYRMKIVRADMPDDHHIVIGVSNVDDQITEEEKLEAGRQSTVTFSSIAEALSLDYFSIYYVDTQTDRFIEYSSHEDYAALGIEKSGEDFFDLSRKNIASVICPEDRDRFLKVFTKERVIKELAEDHTFTMTFRLMFGGVPTYVSMKATRMADPDDPHIVIGVNNINAEMQRRRETVTYAGIARALATDYFSIYYVDTKTDDFIEYSSHQEYEALNIEKAGKDFFELIRKNIGRDVHPDDREMFLEAFSKEKVLEALLRDKTFTLTYRLMFGENSTYVHMKATRMEDHEDPHIVIGISDIDEQMRREQEHSRAVWMASRDPLTGVKNKHAFNEAEKQTNEEIDSGCAGAPEPFAIVVCDLNGLKQVNDTFGHKAGDKYIQSACKTICTTFKHSPVYRIGGDEFVAILRGGDYEIRTDLMARLRSKNVEHRDCGAAVIAAGLADYRPGIDRTFAAVFDRADAAMYEDKRILKGG